MSTRTGSGTKSSDTETPSRQRHLGRWVQYTAMVVFAAFFLFVLLYVLSS